MNKAERTLRTKLWEKEQREKEQRRDKFIEDCNKLSYRNRLLMVMITQFMLENPDDCEGEAE